MGEGLGLSEYKIKELKAVGLLHDIGKIAIDDIILKLVSFFIENILNHNED